MKLLLIGRPGSGKTLAAHLLTAMAQEQGYHALHIDDYPILCKMYHEEGEHTGRFRTVSSGGFDILDFIILDEALQTIEQQIQTGDAGALLIVEFARDDYVHALAQFSQGFMQDASLLYLETDLDTCIERIKGRLTDKTGHASCSEHLLRKYYWRQLLPTALPVEIIDNNGTQEAFEEQVRQFAYTHLEANLAIR